jgi:uncharacterized protein YjiS (DUF1127 family)
MNKTEKISYPFAEVVAVMLAAAYEKARGALRAARDALRAYGEARARAAAATGELQYLSDHVLRDIGLHRSQIRAYLRNGLWW